MDIDLSKIYTPTEKQAKAHACSARFTLFGGSMRSGKSTWLCMEGLQLSLDHPGNVGLLCRWELSSFKRTTLQTLFHFYPPELIKYHNKQEGIIQFINNSKIWYMGLKPSAKASSLERLKSMELGWVGIDEATEIQKEYFDLLITRLSLRLSNGRFPYYRILLASNPEPGWVRGEFIEKHLPDHEFIPALPRENPHLNPDYISKTKKVLPPELVKKYLEGDWDVLEGDNYICPYSLVKQAVEREMAPAKPTEAGVDIARFGGDKNEVAIRKGSVVRFVYESRFQGTMKTVGEVGQVLKDNAPEISKVDTVGVGGGVFDRLKELKFSVSEFIGGGKPSLPERFINVRAEAYWNFRKRLEEGLIDLPDDPELVSQLCGIRYNVKSDMRIQVESKQDMRKRGIKSPNKADAAVMAFYRRKEERIVAASASADSEFSEDADSLFEDEY